MARRKLDPATEAMERYYRMGTPRQGRSRSGEAQLSGFVAKYDSMCKRCHEPILAGQSRVVRHGDGVMHIHCQSGWEDE